MKRLIPILLFPLLLLTLAGTPGKEKLKLMTFDICPPEESGASNSWAKRKDAVVAMLQEYTPDIAAFQRVGPSQAELLKISCPWWDIEYEGNLFVGYSKKRFSLAESGTDEGTLWCKLTSRKTGLELYVFNLYRPDGGTDFTGMEELLEAVKRIAGGSSHVFLAGNFSLEEERYALSHIRSWMGSARKDARITDDSGSYNAFRKYGHITTDHIFYRNARPLQYQVITDSYGVPFISDHYPCYANFELDAPTFSAEDSFNAEEAVKDMPDSVSVARAFTSWEEEGPGAFRLTANLKLFSYEQTISVVKYKVAEYKTGIAANPGGGNAVTSAFAKKVGASLAINGGFFNPKTETPLTYLKSDGKEVGDNNTLAFRYAGLLLCDEGRVKIIPCDTLSYKQDAASWRDALASGPLLLAGGEPVPHDDNPTYKALAPRSCFGYDDNGYAYFITVDGRFDKLATGMTFDQLALFAKYLGLTEAINFDGGGSSTLWTESAGVINYPYDNKVYDHQGQRQVNSIVYAKHL